MTLKLRRPLNPPRSAIEAIETATSTAAENRAGTDAGDAAGRARGDSKSAAVGWAAMTP